ncbi:DUF423 domain-containing protein [Arenibacter aquaticus]|uniref:DUF423 domain-containing protein n=1 Tax=Arenibacter aquaticus TaxID=2489054 RepID=A0A430K920_9FLAO|nr:DUF423 domain-containing protein [Arenibacter aquaticus]RTE55492.1 DUF423 domain-containing protein [Arenibacter aquaticus]
MVLIAHLAGSLYGLLAVIFGAFGAHALKKSLDGEQLKSFETGVKYQMYHAVLLLVLGFNLNMETSLERNMVYCLIIGVFLFSFSIYGLVLSAARGKKWKFLGPITPIGGLLLVTGWGMLLYSFVQNYF